MNVIQRGFWAGVMATGPMTMSLFKFFQNLPSAEKSPLPPATLTQQITKPLKLNSVLPRKFQPDLTMTSHYGYGVVFGILYASTQKYFRASPVVKGSLFGLGLWGASYLGWIPAMGLRASAYNMPRKRNVMMIVSHLVWGASLGLAEEKMREIIAKEFDEVQELPY